jgi:hypothetical protein
MAPRQRSPTPDDVDRTPSPSMSVNRKLMEKQVSTVSATSSSSSSQTPESDAARDKHDIFNLFALVRECVHESTRFTRTHTAHFLLILCFSHSLMSLYLNYVVTRGSIDDCKLRLGKGHKRAKSRVRLDRGLLYRILVGDHVIFPRRSHLGSRRTHLCQESQCYHQGTVLFI